jgi:hypothetical protein
MRGIWSHRFDAARRVPGSGGQRGCGNTGFFGYLGQEAGLGPSDAGGGNVYDETRAPARRVPRVHTMSRGTPEPQPFFQM